MTDTPRNSAVIRRVHAPDAQAMNQFWLRLSGSSRRSRFHGVVNKVSPSFVRGLVSADGQRHAAWVACVWGPHGEEIVGEAVWFVVEPEQGEAEFGISVRDDWQGRGVAHELMRTLVQAAQQSRLQLLYGDVLQSNGRMLAFLRRHGMDSVFCEPPPEPGVLRIGLTFDWPRAPAGPGVRLFRAWLARLASLWP